MNFKNLTQKTTLLALALTISPLAYGYSLVNFQQDVNNLTGGALDEGDVLEYSMKVNNYTVNPLTTPAISALLPFGTTYIDGSASVVSGDGAVTLNTTGNTPELLYNGAQLNSFDAVEIKYQVTVTGSPLYMVDNSARPAILYKVNKADGSVTELNRFANHRSTYGLALTPDSRYLYGVDSHSHEVFKYDLVNETTTTLGRHGLDEISATSVPCLDFDTNGVLWGANAKQDYLFTIDLNTGVATKQADLDFNSAGGDCAFSADGQIYFVGNDNKGGLWVVDPNTGSSTRVAKYDGKNTFTGIALGTDGNVYASDSRNDAIIRINTTDGSRTTLGSLGVPHNSGDLAMTAGQKIQMVSIAAYNDDQGNDKASVIGFEMQGQTPAVGSNSAVPDDVIDPDAVWTEQKLCRVLEGQTTCSFDDDFDPFMRNYIDDVIQHHFGQLEDVIGDSMDILGLDEQNAIDHLIATNSILVSSRNNAKAVANTMVDNWISNYKDQEGTCPHENQLMQNIRQYLTHQQAKTAVDIKLYNNPDTQQCSLYGHDSTIRIGDTSILGWHTSGGTAATLEPYIGGVSTSGTFRIKPLETNTFTLGLYDDTGLVKNCDYQVVVEPACDIGAHKKVISQGSSTTLIWNAEGNAVAEIDNGVGGVGLKGQTSVSPIVSTTYTMQVWQNGAIDPLKSCSYEIIVVDDSTNKNILR